MCLFTDGSSLVDQSIAIPSCRSFGAWNTAVLRPNIIQSCILRHILTTIFDVHQSKANLQRWCNSIDARNQRCVLLSCPSFIIIVPSASRSSQLAARSSFLQVSTAPSHHPHIFSHLYPLISPPPSSHPPSTSSSPAHTPPTAHTSETDPPPLPAQPPSPPHPPSNSPPPPPQPRNHPASGSGNRAVCSDTVPHAAGSDPQTLRPSAHA
jgi:hypothetical protein